MKSIIKPHKKCKGVSKHTIKKEITIDDYRDTLFSSTEKAHPMISIKSHNHIIKRCEITKCSLSCFDNKRYILDDGITILAYGHLVGRETTDHRRQATWLTSFEGVTKDERQPWGRIVTLLMPFKGVTKDIKDERQPMGKRETVV